MIDFVLDTYRQQSVRIHFEGLALSVDSSYTNICRAFDVLEDTGYRKTTFLHLLFAFELKNFRVDQHQRRIAFFRHVYNHQSFVHINLRGSQANARCFVHGFEHIANESVDSAIYL